jgi:hypothetical protein
MLRHRAKVHEAESRTPLALYADVSGRWSMLALPARVRPCKSHRPAAISGQQAGHPVDAEPNHSMRHLRVAILCQDCVPVYRFAFCERLAAISNRRCLHVSVLNN